MIKAIIGLGNPGPKFYATRHNIGFQVVDALANQYNGRWSSKDLFDECIVQINNMPIILIKPTTFMNDSGKVMPYLHKKGIKQPDILVVHDELEKPFGSVNYRLGGSAKGHNGLRSIITHGGEDFGRIRVGIGRPAEREQVPDYVLKPFTEKQDAIDAMIGKALALIEEQLRS
ncbi:MAG: aminoacyl-tRNA hydrolase [Candidatus Babeliales bacterium]